VSGSERTYSVAAFTRELERHLNPLGIRVTGGAPEYHAMCTRRRDGGVSMDWSEIIVNAAIAISSAAFGAWGGVRIGGEYNRAAGRLDRQDAALFDLRQAIITGEIVLDAEFLLEDDSRRANHALQLLKLLAHQSGHPPLRRLMRRVDAEEIRLRELGKTGWPVPQEWEYLESLLRELDGCITDEAYRRTSDDYEPTPKWSRLFGLPRRQQAAADRR
jgi:hypothetical protein